MDNILVKVNGQEIKDSDVIIRLKSQGKYKEALMEEIKIIAIKQAATQRGFEIDDNELQEYADKKRKELGLFSVGETEKYLANLGISIDQWAESVENELLESKVKNKLFTDEDIQAYFDQNKHLYTSVKLHKIVTDDESTAQEIKTQIEEGEDFEEMARDNSTDEATSSLGGYMGIVKRGNLSIDIENRIFSAEEKEVVGPFKEQDEYVIYFIAEKNEAEFSKSIKKEIKTGLFELWKNNLIASAKIEMDS